MKVLLLVPVLMAALVCPRQQGAKAPAKQAEPQVSVTVVAVLASDHCTFIDKDLGQLAALLQKEDPKLTGFCVVSRSQKSLAAKEKGSFACLEDAVVEVVIHQCEDKNNQVHLTVKAPVQGLVVYKANCGKFFPMVTGYEAKEQIPPAWASMAVGHAASPGWMGMVQSMATLTEGRCRPRLVIAICVEPCSGK